MRRWLFKTEPEAFSWDDLVARGDRGEPWDGVRNHAACNHMRAMAVGDRGFLYHSGAARAVVGVVEVVAEAHPDPTRGDDERWDCVDLRAVAPLPEPVTLAAVKANRALAAMALVRQARLSVQPVAEAEWREVRRMGGLDGEPADGS